VRVIDILIALQYDGDELHYTHIWEPLEDSQPACRDVWFWLMRWEDS